MALTTGEVARFVGPSWAPVLTPLFNSDLTRSLVQTLQAERKKYTVFPNNNDVFRAFKECPYDKANVVIVGQDPYHTPKKATGLAFSVPTEESLPPSLQNIFRELEDDLGMETPYNNPDLTRWARQGVLLLNTALTVRQGEPESHSQIWQEWTSRVIQITAEHFHPTIFVGWGRHAQKAIEPHIDVFFHNYIRSAHPSPFSAHRGFYGSKPFSRINEILKELEVPTINWFAE